MNIENRTRRSRREIWVTAVGVGVALVVGTVAMGTSGAPEPAAKTALAPPAAGSLGPEAFLGCRSEVVIGTVTLAVARDDARQLVTMDVEDWVKPATGAAVAVLDVERGSWSEPLEVGERVLLGIPSETNPYRVTTVERLDVDGFSRMLKKALPDSKQFENRCAQIYSSDGPDPTG
jgi:hypothetical protein